VVAPASNRLQTRHLEVGVWSGVAEALDLAAVAEDVLMVLHVEASTTARTAALHLARTLNVSLP
jgi:L-alanine-DL-glutamate epimerase-like enolase superfamily enzyme